MNTGLAVQAFLLVVKNLHLAQLGFRIGAPFAPKRTSFQKDGCPDSRSVVDAEFLYDRSIEARENVLNETFDSYGGI